MIGMIRILWSFNIDVMQACLAYDLIHFNINHVVNHKLITDNN